VWAEAEAPDAIIIGAESQERRGRWANERVSSHNRRPWCDQNEIEAEREAQGSAGFFSGTEDSFLGEKIRDVAAPYRFFQSGEA